jgi:membrane fusion protein (multidrug efflux system)
MTGLGLLRVLACNKRQGLAEHGPTTGAILQCQARQSVVASNQVIRLGPNFCSIRPVAAALGGLFGLKTRRWAGWTEKQSWVGGGAKRGYDRRVLRYRMAYTEAVHMPGGSVSDIPSGSRAFWRKRLLTGLALCTLVAGAAAGTRWYLESARSISTDDAYVDAPLAEITPQIDGTIQRVAVSDTQHVRRGDLLVQLDPADANLAVQQTRAAQEQALRRVEQYLANIRAAEANVAGKRSNLTRAETALRRRKSVSERGAVSAEEISNATNAWDAAKTELTIAEQQLAAQQSLVRGEGPAHNPEVLQAKAALDKALLDLARTQIRAPVDGVVAGRHAQIGQRIRVGSNLMNVVPLMDAHVDANFKEVQLQNIQPGQNAELISDLYGADVVFHGRVEGLGGGTGSAFAVIPAQNATGNWIKVVQRLPVRIALDREELARHPLRVGISMTAKVYLTEPARQPVAPRTTASRSGVPALRMAGMSYGEDRRVRLAQMPLLRTVAPRASYADNDAADRLTAPALRPGGAHTSY